MIRRRGGGRVKREREREREGGGGLIEVLRYIRHKLNQCEDQNVEALPANLCWQSAAAMNIRKERTTTKYRRSVSNINFVAKR